MADGAVDVAEEFDDFEVLCEDDEAFASFRPAVQAAEHQLMMDTMAGPSS